MELSSFEEVEKLIEQLVTSGKPNLDNSVMKNLKSLCKHDDSCLNHSFNVLLSQLVKDHCEVRYSAFQIVCELFVRSHLFRTLLLDNFHQFMDCTIETDFDNPLPPPKNVAVKLKEDALLAIKTWYEKYGIAYQKLSLAFEYLKNSNKFKFNQPRPTVRNFNQELTLSRKSIVNGMKLDKLNKDINENMWEISFVLTEMNNCLELLVPCFDHEQSVAASNLTDDTDVSEHKKHAMSLRETGLPEHGYVVELDLSELSTVKVVENEDNKAMFDRLKDLLCSINRIHLPRLRLWLNIASKCGAEPGLIKKLIDLKVQIQCTVNKCDDMQIVYESEDEDGNADDFIEVPDDIQPSTKSLKVLPKLSSSKKSKKQLKLSTDIWKPLKDGDEDLSDPTTYKFALAKQAKILKEKKANSPQPGGVKLKKIFPKTKNTDTKTQQLIKKAPIVSFGHDLLAWDPKKYEELKSTISLSGSKELDVGHRYYGGHSASETDKGISDAAMSSITSRTITFTGEFEPVMQSCKAPLQNGKLCSRQDRYKCPFHGKIIPRDASGNPIERNDQPSTSNQGNSWNDPEFLQDLQGNLGSAVSVLRKSKKNKNNSTGLTDLKKTKNTARSRLQRKVLSSKSLKRVAETMNTLDAKRNLDKFGNNFNYALH